MSEKQYKICANCHEKNDISESFCTECFGTIFTVADNEGVCETSYKNTKQTDKIYDDVNNKTTIEARQKQLNLSFDNINISIHHNDIIGRSGKFSKYFQNFNKVSREHVKFYFDENSWYVEDLKSTNGTYINKEKMPSETKVQLHHADILKLSTTFTMTVILSDL